MADKPPVERGLFPFGSAPEAPDEVVAADGTALLAPVQATMLLSLIARVQRLEGTLAAEQRAAALLEAEIRTIVIDSEEATKLIADLQRAVDDRNREIVDLKKAIADLEAREDPVAEIPAEIVSQITQVNVVLDNAKAEAGTPENLTQLAKFDAGWGFILRIILIFQRGVLGA